MTARNYSSTTPAAVLLSSISDTDLSITITNYGDVWPAAPFTMILDYDTASEEVVEVTSKNGTNNFFTVTRGVDGTTAKSHSAGAGVVHGVSARDFTEPAAEIAALQGGQYKAVQAIGGAAYGPVVADAGKLILGNHSANMTVTLPSDSTAAFPTGARIDFIVSTAYTLTFAAGSGATVNSKDGALTVDTQFGAATAVKSAANNWVLVGGLA